MLFADKQIKNFYKYKSSPHLLLNHSFISEAELASLNAINIAIRWSDAPAAGSCHCRCSPVTQFGLKTRRKTEVERGSRIVQRHKFQKWKCGS